MEFIALGLLGLAGLALSSKASAAIAPAVGSRVFPDGGTFYARFCSDFAAAGAPSWLNRELCYVVAEIETDFGRSLALAQTNSYFNRHIGSGNGEWSGHAYTTTPPAGRDPEILRIYSDRGQSIRDFAQLVSGSQIYSSAYNAMLAGDPDGFFVGLVTGKNGQGYVGAVPSTKAANYLSGLRSRYNRSLTK